MPSLLAISHNMIIYFLRDLASGNKKCKFLVFFHFFLLDLNNINTQNLYIPNYDGLECKSILGLLLYEEAAFEYLLNKKRHSVFQNNFF